MKKACLYCYIPAFYISVNWLVTNGYTTFYTSPIKKDPPSLFWHG